MRVLHVYKVYLPENYTGVPRVIHQLAEGTARHGIESHVLTLTGDRDIATRKIGKHYVHYARRNLHIASTGFSASVFKKYRELAEQADLIHYHFPWPLADILHLLVGARKPSIVTYHSDVVRQRFLLPLYARLMHRFLDSVDVIVATSPPYAETSDVLARHQAKVSVIPIGIGERNAPPGALVDDWHKRLGEGFLLFVGALRYYKGLPFLLEAARRTGLPVVVAGSPVPADFDTRTAPSNMRFVGEVSDPDKEALLTLCRAFVFPSHVRSEAFGVALLEAARAARPLISCEIGTGTSFVNENGVTGYVVEPADVDALAAGMSRLAGDPDAAQLLGANARARFERLFHADDMCNAYAELYRQLLSRHMAEGRQGVG